jgi:trehalose synthase
MLQQVDVGARSIGAYAGVAPDDILSEVERIANDLRGVRVLHLNATPYGGGVSELLRSIVPLLDDLGVAADWRIISGDDTFFDATKALHNGLQGAPAGLTEAQRTAFLTWTGENARQMASEYDVVVVHDPQPAGIPAVRGRGRARWIWRCHIDTSGANQEAWALLRPLLADYDAAVFTMPEFVPADLPVERVEIIPPAIDPLSPKNLTLPEGLARAVLGWIGIELDRPLVTQVSRFDPWKDPLGVIAAYRLVRERHPQLQLALVGSMALDDPQGWSVYEQIHAAIRGDPLIHVFTNLSGVGNVEVNAFQRLSDVVIQKSIREGFGLVVSEAMWKGTPVVAGRAGGIPLQMADGVGGILVGSVEEAAAAIVQLLDEPALAEDLGRRGHERVRERFLLPRLLLDELRLLRSLVQA